MAGAHGAATIAAAATTSSPLLPASPIPKKPLILASSLSSSFPSRRSRRTNHLRQKILKTLEMKPYPDTSNPELPRKTDSVSMEEQVQQHPAESEQFTLSETTGFVDGIIGNFSTKSFVKIGLYLVGAFIFQTICAVLIFGSNELKDEDGKSNSDEYKKARLSDLSVNSNNNLIETKSGGMVLVDDSEMDNRILEIQEMAREARKQERIEARRKGLVEEGDDVDDDDVNFDLIDKTLKGKEVDGRLMKLRKSLEGNYEKLPSKFPRNDDNVSNNEAFDSLMFKKKYKYKSPSIDSVDKPKGFDGSKDGYVANGTLINGTIIDGTLQTDKKNDDVSSDNGVDILDNSEQIDTQNGNELEIRVTRDDTKVQEPIETESIAGTSKEPKYDKQASKTAESGKSRNLETKKPRGFGQESQSDAAISTKHYDYSKNGSLKSKKRGNRKSAKNHGAIRSGTQTDFWWTSLPYVLAVLMQRGGNGEESGLFTLRSQTNYGLSHTVAFEDHGDATNFSYLLESFFEDLGDFHTNIIPIPTNELEEAINTQMMKVVVVKKGQLKLYVGQPLEDVESALLALIE